MRSAAWPAESVQGSSAGRTEMGPGTGRPSGAGAQAPNPRGRISRAARESGSWSCPSRRGDHVPPGCPEFAGGSECAGAHGVNGGGGFGSRGCSRWYPTFLRTPGRTPAPTPDSAVPQSCQEAEGGRRLGGGQTLPPSPRPGPAVPQRCGGAPSSPVPVVRTGCSGGSGKKDPRPVAITLESSDSVLIENRQTVSWGRSAAE